MLTVVALPLALLSLQQHGIAQRLAGRVPPVVAARVQELGIAAASRGLPVEPLIQKAIEGSAKKVPVQRVTAAVRLVMMQLDSAAVALREGGAVTDTVVIAAGAFAINAGLSGPDVTALARTHVAASALTVGLRVAGTLVAMGVPPAEDIGLVSAKLRAGEAAADLLALPSDVQAAVSRGATPAQAAAGLERGPGGQGRHGPPPGRGPDNHPPHPSPRHP